VSEVAEKVVAVDKSVVGSSRFKVFRINGLIRNSAPVLNYLLCLQGLCPKPHLLFVLNQKVGSTFKAAFLVTEA
jgi:hypothetical protein